MRHIDSVITSKLFASIGIDRLIMDNEFNGKTTSSQRCKYEKCHCGIKKYVRFLEELRKKKKFTVAKKILI